MKYRLKFTPQTLDYIGAVITPAQLNFVACLIDSYCHLYIHQSVSKCTCGRLIYFLASRTGKHPRGMFCVVCSFKEIPFL